MLIFHLIAILQLIAAQSNALMLNPNVIRGPDACQSRRAAVDLAISNTSQSVRGILSTFVLSLDPPCGRGPWIRVAYLNMTDPLQQCPTSWRLYSANGVRACGRLVTSSGGCYSHNYTVQQNYQRVCGRIIGYQVGSPDVFHDRQVSIDEPYVDGVSMTYGQPRRHIWTFAAGLSETTVTTRPDHEKFTCPCALNGTGFRMQQPSAFVGNHYFCESGNPLPSFVTNGLLNQYVDDPLWDGQRCEGQCCTNSNSPPWFSVTLPGVTSEEIEVRICSNQGTHNEDTPITLLEIYVQ